MTNFARDEDMKMVLKNSRRIAVVGLSPKQSRPSYGVAHFLQNAGYEIIPVNPNTDEVLGKRSYPHISSIPGDIDAVDVFRKSEYVTQIVDDVLEDGRAKYVWLQEGVIDEAAAARAREAGLTVVMDRCMLKEYQRFSMKNQG